MNRWLWGDIWESLVGRPGRTLLALLSIAIGTLSLTVLLSSIVGLSEKARKITGEFGADLLAVIPQKSGLGTRGLDRNDLSVLRGSLPELRISGVKHYTVQLPEQETPLRLLAGDESLLQVRPWTIEQGRFLDAMDMARSQRYALISTGLARAHALEVGDYLRVYPYHFEIVGILRAGDAALMEARPDLASGSEFAVVPYSVRPVWEGDAMSTGDQLDTVFIKYPPDHDPAAVIARIQNVLAPFQPRLGRPVYVSAETLILGIRQLRRTIELTTGSIAVLCLVLGGTTLMSLMIAEVRERVGEIGLRMTLGASGSDIYLLFVLQALVTTGLAALIGSGSAFFLLAGARQWITFPLYIGPSVFLWPVAVALILGMVFSFWPAYRAAGITPSEALRNE